jgi:hypothetical protein
MLSLPELRDATLINISLEWAAGVALVTFRFHGFGGMVVEAKDLFELKCPRLLPWGPSNSVNSAELKTLLGSQCLTIEMQSGDVLEISCREVSVKPIAE